MKLQLLLTMIYVGSALGSTSFEKQEERAVLFHNKMAQIFQKKNIGQACALFAHDQRWNHAPFYMFVVNPERGGSKLVDQLRPDAIWSHFLNKTDFSNNPLLETMLTAREGKWIDFWRFNKLFHVYVKTVEKYKINYVLGVGFFPEGRDYLCKTLLKAVMTRVNNSTTLDVANSINNIHGGLILGDVYATIMDSDGICWAQGNNYLLASQNLLTGADADFYKQILSKATQGTKKSGSFDYEKNKEHYKVFYQTYQEKGSNQTFIVSTGYYKDTTFNTVELMANTIEELLKKSDKTIFDRINQSQDLRDSLITHGLSALILDQKTGKILAGTESQLFAQLGRSFFDYYGNKQQAIGQTIKEIMQKQTTSFISRFSKNCLERLYVKKMQTNFGTFIIIIQGYFPSTKKELAPILAGDAVRFLTRQRNINQFDYMNNEDSPFFMGDIRLTIHDQHGFLWLDGTSYESLWSIDKTIGKAPEGWIADQRRYPIERKVFRQLLPPVLPEQPEPLIIGAYYSELIQ